MTKNNKILIFFLVLIFYSCKKDIVKGVWSESDKQKFYKEMESIDFSGREKYKIIYIKCCLDKAETNYSSYYDGGKDYDKFKKLCLECASKIIKETENER